MVSSAGSLEEDLDSVLTDLGVLADAENTVAFHLLAEAEKYGHITKEEGDMLRERYRRTFELAEYAKASDLQLTRRLKVLEADIVQERILVEKLRIEEVEETLRVQRAGEARNALQKELEEVEQKDTMVKFELFELKRVHEELVKTLEGMKQQNNQLVEPVLENLRKEIARTSEELQQTEEAYERESAQKQAIEARVAEIAHLQSERDALAKLKAEHLGTVEAEPGRLQRQIASIAGAQESMQRDLQQLQRKFDALCKEADEQTKRKQEAEKMRASILEKLELNRQTLEEREQAVASISASLAQAKAKAHDLVTRKVELNARKRELDSQLRHLRDQNALAAKDYEQSVRQIKKKRIVLDLSRQNLPGLEQQLRDAEAARTHLQDHCSTKRKEVARMREEVDAHVARLLQQEGVETSKKNELEAVIAEVDELEKQVVQTMAESKRQAKLLSVLSAQRDIKSRENARVESKEKEAKLAVRMKELTILDLTKRCNEITNRLKEFSALYEVVKNERNKYVNLIQSSAQALAEMREKIRILQNEVEILSNERAAKDLALTKERNAHQQAQNQRDSLRQDLNRLLSDYRSRQGTVEQQIQEIDKLNVIINALEKDMLQLKSRYERAVEARNVTGVQLIDRNDELCILYERSNQQQEALRRGEGELIKKNEELRLLRLSFEELQRKYLNAKHRLPEITRLQTRIEDLEEKLRKQRLHTEEFSKKLEDPDNLERWRPLEGSDPDLEQLMAKIKVLEDRVDRKREILLEKELVFEEISSLTDKLRHQAVSKREAAKLLADELNDLHGKIRDVTKRMLASVSELSMYQATALRLQQEKIAREKAAEEAQWRVAHDEPPSEQAQTMLFRSDRAAALREEWRTKKALEMPMLDGPGGQFLLRTAAEPRPTAYIPDDVGIPKPYGSLAPFKPTEAGSTMRHIRPPVIKPIEI